MRINRLSEALRILSEILLSENCPPDRDLNTSVMDSLPIITCSGKRSPSVAKEITDKDYLTRISNSGVLTPVKAVKNQAQVLIQRDKAANDLFSRAVSAIRQSIESLFNWIIEKTDIQRASKVRSTRGLPVHVFGRIAAAFIFLIF